MFIIKYFIVERTLLNTYPSASCNLLLVEVSSDYCLRVVATEALGVEVK